MKRFCGGDISHQKVTFRDKELQKSVITERSIYLKQTEWENGVNICKFSQNVSLLTASNSLSGSKDFLLKTKTVSQYDKMKGFLLSDLKKR